MVLELRQQSVRCIWNKIINYELQTNLRYNFAIYLIDRFLSKRATSLNRISSESAKNNCISELNCKLNSFILGENGYGVYLALSV